VGQRDPVEVRIPRSRSTVRARSSLARVSARSAFAVARCSLAIRSVLVASPATAATTASATATAVTTALRFRRANLRERYQPDGGHACTGSSSRYRSTSAAKSLAVS